MCDTPFDLSLACCDSWGCEESDMTERLNLTELVMSTCFIVVFFVFFVDRHCSKIYRLSISLLYN